MAIDIIHFKSHREAAKPGIDKRTTERADIRRKYELGELVLEAGLSGELSTVVLGMLLEAKAKLDSKEGQEWRRRWWSKGDRARTKAQHQA